MNKQTRRGGEDSAFPREDYQGGGQGQIGMSMRDYFAAKAMQADITAAGSHEAGAEALAYAAADAGVTIEQRIAFNAYQIADAMLAERAK